MSEDKVYTTTEQVHSSTVPTTEDGVVKGPVFTTPLQFQRLRELFEYEEAHPEQAPD
jgi:hypothetical protein